MGGTFLETLFCPPTGGRYWFKIYTGVIGTQQLKNHRDLYTFNTC